MGERERVNKSTQEYTHCKYDADFVFTHTIEGQKTFLLRAAGATDRVRVHGFCAKIV